MMRLGLTFVVSLPLVGALPAQAAYAIVDLRTVPGGTGSTTALEMNARGDCIGWAIVGSAPHAFLYTDGQGMQDLGLLPGNVNAQARGINLLREVVGDATFDSWRWSPAAGLTPFVPPTLTQPLAINNHGMIVGTLNPGTFSPRPFLYTPAQGIVQFAGAAWGHAVDVNNQGVVLGDWGGSGGSTYAAATGSQALPTLPNFPTNAPSRINDVGQVAGNAIPLVGVSTWFRYTPGVGIVDVGRPGSFGGGLGGMNNFGELVGTHAAPIDQAYLYTDAGGFQNLNALVPVGSGYVLRRGVAINDAGQILCEAYHSASSTFRAVRLDPVARRAWIESVGVGCGTPAPPRLGGNRPVLGGTLNLAVGNAAPFTVGILAGHIGPPVASSLAPGCVLWIDTANIFFAMAVITDGSGAASLRLPLPGTPQLAGLPLTVQVGTAGTAAPPGVDLGNALFLELGTN